MKHADKQKIWQHIKQHSPAQEGFIHAPRDSFGVSYRTIKTPLHAINGVSNNNSSIAGTYQQREAC